MSDHEEEKPSESYVYVSDTEAPPPKELPKRWQDALEKTYEERTLQEKVVIDRIEKMRERRVNQRMVNVVVDSMRDFKTNDLTKVWAENKSLPVAHGCREGMREGQEDAYSVGIYEGKKDPSEIYHFYCVFDGHAGTKASELAGKTFVDYYAKAIDAIKESDMGGLDAVSPSDEQWEKIHKKAHKDCDDYIYKTMEDDDALSGCTSVVCIHDLKQKKLRVAHLGDSRCIIFQGDKEFFQTDDHKPNREDERIRIVMAGGIVRGNRVMGDLAVSRALGDFKFKQRTLKGSNKYPGYDPSDTTWERALIGFAPEVETFNIAENYNPEDKCGLTILLCCDGVFDVYKRNKNLLKLVNEHLYNEDNLKGRSEEDMLRLACDRVTLSAYDRGSNDNITCLVAKINV